MKPALKYAALLFIVLSLVFPSVRIAAGKEHDQKKEAETIRLSQQTQACIGCHSMITPGIVEDWRSSRHSRTIPSEAMKKPSIQRRISAEALSNEVSEHVVGCFECTLGDREGLQDTDPLGLS